jgi:hypothetical protein
MSELVAMLRNLARTVFGKDNPGFATSEQMAAEAVAMEAIPRIEGNIRANVDDVRPYMAKSKIRVTDPEEYAREVYRVVADKDTEGLKNLGLSPIELITLAAENGFLFKNIQKLDELNQNASVKMGDLEDQRPHTGGTSDAEMANAGNEFGYTTLAWLRKIVNDDVKSMYDMSVVGNADLLAAFSGGILKSGVDVFGPGGDYTSGTREINKRQRQTLKELADNAQVFQEETGIAPRSTYMLRRVNRVISKHEAVDMAVPELRNEGITAEDIQGVVAYIQAARQHTTASMQAEKNPFNREKLRTKATYLEDLGRVMQNVAQYIPVPGFTPEGSANAHAILLRGQQENAWKQISSAVRTEVATEIMRQTGMSRKDAEAAYLANSRGTVSPSEGSSRELKFHAIIDVPNMDSKLEVSGTVNNSGGLDDVHTLVDGNIYLEAPSPVR